MSGRIPLFLCGILACVARLLLGGTTRVVARRDRAALSFQVSIPVFRVCAYEAFLHAVLLRARDPRRQFILKC